MPPEDHTEEEEGEDWAPEKEETAPEFMEPVVEVGVTGDNEVDLTKTRREREAKSSKLYRERVMVEEVVEETVEPTRHPTRAERRRERKAEKLQRAMEREARRRRSWLRSTLAYKTFYDMVCNRVGVIIAGFGVAMILFTMLYDWIQGRPFSLGTRHTFALTISLIVYFFGMGLEGLRVLSWECEGLESAAIAAQATGQGTTRRTKGPEKPAHIPLVPDEALEELLNNEKDDKRN
jgi:hypothetical protein